MLCCWRNKRRNCRKLTVDDVVTALKHSGISNANQEALWLMSYALGVGTAEIFSRKKFSPDESAKVEAVISRRISGEPLQYITGVADFYGRDFRVGKGVLIPRHDTETLIDGVKECFCRDGAFRFLDWGTGSGCLGVTVLLEFPHSFGVLHDVSNEALRYARENVRFFGVSECAEFSGVVGEFDAIISNPPYIPSSEIAGLMHEVRDFEPLLALDGGDDGMRFYREIVNLAGVVLRQGGYLLLEAGNMIQHDALKSYGGLSFEGEIFDGGNFPRCVILRKEGRP